MHKFVIKKLEGFLYKPGFLALLKKKKRLGDIGPSFWQQVCGASSGGPQSPCYLSGYLPDIAAVCSGTAHLALVVPEFAAVAGASCGVVAPKVLEESPGAGVLESFGCLVRLPCLQQRHLAAARGRQRPVWNGVLD